MPERWRRTAVGTEGTGLGRVGFRKEQAGKAAKGPKGEEAERTFLDTLKP